MNEYDSNRIIDMTKKIDYIPTQNISEADCYILNTCHIREKATQKVYHDVGRVKKQFKNKKKPIFLVTGCVAQAEGNIMLQKEKYIDGVIGPQSYHKLNEIIRDIEKNKNQNNFTEFEVVEKFDLLNNITNNSSKISSFLTIQEGCDKFCKFCVVPYTRGPEHSRSFQEIISESNHLINNGVKEITLLGQNVNAYNFKNYKLSHLIQSLNEIKGLKRIRYTTSHPSDVTDDLIEVHGKCEKLMPLLHLPVQSGSNKILKKMNRKHTVEEYIRIIDKIKNKKNSIKFSSDFIIAYPGESEKDFNASINLLKKINFINSFSFIYSPRPGTPATNLNILDTSISKQRLKIFQQVADSIKSNYRKNLVNKKVKVLFENKLKNSDSYFGRDEYSNSVVVNSEVNLTGKLCDVIIKDFNKNTLFGNTFSKANDREFAA
tara:strand:- start:1021 stop:2316 length:1296 start_codon:yes stop_codon:yes gene_type:complete